MNGSSGSPIFLEKSELVIGIHKEGHITKLENYGSFLYPIIESLKNVVDEQYAWEEGDYYIGPLFYELPNGNGKKYFKDGRIFEGNFVNGKREGFGRITFPNKKNSFFYIGEYKNDVGNGKGKEFYENGKVAYDGDFVNNNRQGYGKEYYENGKLKYEGNFINDKYEGNGKYYYEDGNSYEGQWSKDQRNGKGKLLDKNKKTI